MTEETSQSQPADRKQAPAFQVRLPGFILDEEVGLGEMIERMTGQLGITPCQSCHKRAASLNRWVVFSR
jgi:hypothetical protein